jgi:hypothetical protein
MLGMVVLVLVVTRPWHHKKIHFKGDNACKARSKQLQAHSNTHISLRTVRRYAHQVAARGPNASALDGTPLVRIHSDMSNFFQTGGQNASFHHISRHNVFAKNVWGNPPNLRYTGVTKTVISEFRFEVYDVGVSAQVLVARRN